MRNVPFYNDWSKHTSAYLSERAAAAWRRGEFEPGVTESLVRAATEPQALAHVVELDAVAFGGRLAAHRDAVAALPESQLKDAAIALVALYDGRVGAAIALAREVVQSLTHADPAVAGAFCVALAEQAAASARWADAAWFVDAARSAHEELRTTRPADDLAAERLWFSLMAVGVRVEWHDDGSEEQFAVLAEALRNARSRNRLAEHHATALVGVARVLAARGDLTAAGVNLARATQLVPETFPVARAAMLFELAFVRVRQGRWNDAAAIARDAERIAHARQPAVIGAATTAVLAAMRGDAEAARRAIAHAEAALTERWDVFAAAVLTHARLVLAFATQDWPEAVHVLEDAADTAYPRTIAADEWRALQGIAFTHNGNTVRAAALLAEWAAQPDAQKSPYFWIMTGFSELVLGEQDRALASARRALDLLTGGEDPLGSAQVLVIAGTVLSHCGDVSAGVEAYETARHQLLGLGAAGLAAACTRIIERTAAELADGVDPLSVLTEHQRRVALLVGEGFTSSEIADLLHLSRKTVDFHVGNSLGRLGLANRRQLRRLVLTLRDDAGAAPHGAGLGITPSPSGRWPT